MKDSLVKEIEHTLDTFFATATDEEFLSALDRADYDVYSKITVPVLDLQEKVIGRYSVTAIPSVVPQATMPTFFFSEVVSNEATSFSMGNFAI